MERVGSLLKDLEGADTLRKRIAEARGLASWTEIVGTHLAQRTRALRLAGGRLFVVCHGSSLRQELSFHRREILRRFREVAGPGATVRELVLLESDANLSSLVREAELEEGRVPANAKARVEAPATASPATTGAEEAEPSAAERLAASYPKFDAKAYREEMRRIAERGEGEV